MWIAWVVALAWASDQQPDSEWERAVALFPELQRHTPFEGGQLPQLQRWGEDGPQTVHVPASVLDPSDKSGSCWTGEMRLEGASLQGTFTAPDGTPYTVTAGRELRIESPGKATTIVGSVLSTVDQATAQYGNPPYTLHAVCDPGDYPMSCPEGGYRSCSSSTLRLTRGGLAIQAPRMHPFPESSFNCTATCPPDACYNKADRLNRVLDGRTFTAQTVRPTALFLDANVCAATAGQSTKAWAADPTHKAPPLPTRHGRHPM